MYVYSINIIVKLMIILSIYRLSRNLMYYLCINVCECVSNN